MRGLMLQSSKKGKKNGLLWKNLGEEEKLCKNGGFVKGFLLEEITRLLAKKQEGIFCFVLSGKWEKPSNGWRFQVWWFASRV